MPTEESIVTTKTKQKENLNSNIVIFIIALIVAVCTYFVPAGQYEREVVNDRTLYVQGSYTVVEQNPIGPWEFFRAIPKAFVAQSATIWMILLISAMMKCLENTGVLEKVLKKVLVGVRGKEEITIIVLAVFFSILGGTGTFLTPIIAVLPLGVMVSRTLGYDDVVGFMITYGGCSAGFSAGWANVYTTAVAQDIAEMPIFSQPGIRIVEHVVLLAIMMFVTIRYGRKVKADPSFSLIPDYEPGNMNIVAPTKEELKLTTHQLLAGLSALIGFAFLIISTLVWKFATNDITSLFFVMAIVIGLLGGLGPNGTAKAFSKGVSEMAGICVILGMSRAISVIMEDARIIDTVVYYASLPIAAAGPIFGLGAMLLFNLLFNFFVPGGTSLCLIVMPLQIPIADLAGISRLMAIESFKLGESITNMIFPTVPTFMACLAYMKVPYSRWVKWALPWIIALSVASYLIIVGGHLIGL
ncbi:MAG: AbgT family transporter [Clostridiales Family XIII bacterium]|jgi:uncharacterized ion transporter superfamily protein YfcC|nr:AbgT family transporter [Clostridiales Family XIII bacterium]